MQTDYPAIGFKCGIEIHQQLETHKLFCSCPSTIREDAPSITVERRMRAVAGELGGVDPAALHEFLRNRTLLYEVHDDTTCLVELDEEPPHPLNEEALEITAEVAIMLKARIVDELHVMRKTVIDGSNTAGFQRTMLVAMNGTLDTSEGLVGIPTVCLEEDAARKIAEKDNTITYRLDRLGIPLVEIATTPVIKNPKHARETAEKIGMMLRATGRVKRGLGTIRQDINVSIRGGARVEIKGVQALNDITKLLENEVARQLALIGIQKELAERSVSDKDITNEFIDVSDIFKEHGKDWIKAKLSSGEKATAVRLKGYAGLLGKELMPDYRFGTELARIAKAAAGLGGIIHSDENIDAALKEKITGRLKAGGTDGFACVIANENTAKRALSVITARCKTALKGVPEETRMAVGERTEYMRPLPGSERMYPETDELFVVIGREMLERAKSKLPELFEEKAKRYEKMGLSGELAAQLSKTQLAGTFESQLKAHPKLKPSTIAAVLLMAPKEAKKRFNANIEVLQEGHYESILGMLESGLITKEAVVELLAHASKNPEKPLETTAKENNLTAMDEKELAELIKNAVEQNKGMPAGALLGKIMGQCKGRADAETVRRMLTDKLG
ncbi:MAG: Glu-tRNA(Gln) amidotransferase subunit GatE [Candidatus Altiarchaeota archaeon]|nr:Glu-tRNA(Gln) amidotransferase subunit GatE [Candidatus Altiarchaeota archaeon]